SVPMQPRSRPHLKSVTNVAPGAASAGCPVTAHSGPARAAKTLPASASSVTMARRAIVTSKQPRPASRIDGLLEMSRRDALRRILRERKCGVADHSRFFARGVARIAQVDELGREAMPPRAKREAVDRRGPARL